MRSRRSRPGLVSMVMLAGSVALFGAVAWSRVAADDGWRRELRGVSVGTLPAAAPTGEPAEVRHPALIYFFETPCGPCVPARARLNELARTRMPGALPIYALTNSPAFTADSAAAFHPPIRPVRLRQSTRELRFVKELPLFVRTDSSGRVADAYAGVPTLEDLTALGYPWQASTTGRR